MPLLHRVLFNASSIKVQHLLYLSRSSSICFYVFFSSSHPFYVTEIKHMLCTKKKDVQHCSKIHKCNMWGRGWATNIHLQLANVSKINQTTKTYNQTTEMCPQYVCTETQCNNTNKNYRKFILILQRKMHEGKTTICSASLQFIITPFLTQRCWTDIAFIKFFLLFWL